MTTSSHVGQQAQLLQTVTNEDHSREENAAAYDLCAKDYDKVSALRGII